MDSKSNMTNMIGINKQNNSVVYVFVASIILTNLFPYIGRFGFLDELLVLMLIIQCFGHGSLYLRMREIRIVLWIFLFYIVYSLYCHNNVTNAIIRDALIFTKPFVCFYSAYVMGFDLSEKLRKRCKYLMLVLGMFLWVEAPFIDVIYTVNTTAYYPACAYTGVGYLMFSEFKKKDIIISSLILMPGLLSVRAKYFAEVVIWFSIWLILKYKVKVNLRYIILGAIILYVIYYINYEKIVKYFVNGIDDGMARSVMYVTAIEIFKDYMPFGPGFGTFATDSAAKYYSPINYRYGLDRIWGLNPDDAVIGTRFYNDTFYPILAQFGIVGFILFCWFLKRRWDESKVLSSMMQYKIFLFVFAYLLIQCIAENTFTGANGLTVMLAMGLMLSPKTNLNVK